MRKTKILAFITLILLLAVNKPALAVDTNYLTTGINLPEATFDVEEPSNETPSEVADLKETLQLLRSELGEMKTGMKQLQAKVVEAEMYNLQEQLADLQKEIAAEKETNSTEVKIIELDSGFEPAEKTPKITKIEDFIGFDLEEEISTNEELGAETVKAGDIEEKVAEETTEEDPEISEELAEKDAEIAELKAALAKKEELEEEKATHSEIKEQAEEAELEKVEVADAVEKLAGIKVSKSSSIIAKSNGEILYQFPRSISRKTGESEMIAQNKELGAKQLKAHLLKAENISEEEDNFKRSAATSKESSIFSARNISIMGGILGAAIVSFIIWLIRHEKKLLAATSQRFQQLDLRPDFELRSHSKNKKPSHSRKNIIQ